MITDDHHRIVILILCRPLPDNQNTHGKSSIHHCRTSTFFQYKLVATQKEIAESDKSTLKMVRVLRISFAILKVTAIYCCGSCWPHVERPFVHASFRPVMPYHNHFLLMSLAISHIYLLTHIVPGQLLMSNGKSRSPSVPCLARHSFLYDPSFQIVLLVGRALKTLKVLDSITDICNAKLKLQHTWVASYDSRLISVVTG